MLNQDTEDKNSLLKRANEVFVNRATADMLSLIRHSCSITTRINIRIKIMYTRANS